MSGGNAEPVLVGVGGGHGLSMTLGALGRLVTRPVGIVSMADDGGSSGRLRRDRDLGAPGDLRRCLLALADADDVLVEALGHRFTDGELAGHVVGNVVLRALAERRGSLALAAAELAERLGVGGQVVPATDEPVRLVAETPSGTVVGQVQVSAAETVTRVRLDPAGPSSPSDVPRLLGAARLVVLGPGSPRSSVLAAALAPAVREGLAASPGLVVLVGNRRLDGLEAPGPTLADHVAELVAHGVRVDRVLADRDGPEVGDCEIPVQLIEAGDRGHPAHDPVALSRVLGDLIT